MFSVIKAMWKHQQAHLEREMQLELMLHCLGFLAFDTLFKQTFRKCSLLNYVCFNAHSNMLSATYSNVMR